MTTSTTTPTKYSVDVTPSFGPNLAPIFEASIYRMIPGGICSPIGDEEVIFESIAQLDAWLAGSGFRRTDDFGDVCANGFASAPLASMPIYSVGDIITYRTFMGTVKEVRVEERSANIAGHGKAGFDAFDVHTGEAVYGYDDQVIALIAFAEDLEFPEA